MVVFGRKWEVLSKACLKKCGLFLTRDILPAACDPCRFDPRATFGLPLLPLSSSAPTPPRRLFFHVTLTPNRYILHVIVIDCLSPCIPCIPWIPMSLFPLTHLVPLLFWALLSSFVVTFKKRCLYLFIGICGTWVHRFVFWKLYLKPGLITSFRLALRSVWMDVWKHWSLSGLITFSMLPEALRSCDLSRKIEGDSVCRVIDQILGS